MNKCLIDSDSDNENDNNEKTNNINSYLTSKKNQKKNTEDNIETKIYGVSELNYEIQNLIKNKISKIEIIGEITNLSFRNHLYFSLKDKDSKIDCFLWESIYKKTNIEIKNGDKIVCKGIFSLYHRLGKLQMTLESYYLDGEGELQKKFLEQKNHLDSLGYFKEENKKKLKKYNHKIGIVTSIDSAAFQDVLSVIKRKNPTNKLFVSDCRVQGNKCENDISDSLIKLDKLDLDVIIVTRGGGSLEDLWGFNEKNVVETIFNCDTPIISAVGHQIDFTLSDYVADIRAITPSIGGDIAVTNIEDIIKNIDESSENIKSKIKLILLDAENNLKNSLIKLERLYPMKEIISIQNKIESVFEKINIESKNKTDKYLVKINENKRKLELINPRNLLKKGYSIVQNDDKKSIKSLSDLKQLEYFTLVLADGEIKIKL